MKNIDRFHDTYSTMIIYTRKFIYENILQAATCNQVCSLISHVLLQIIIINNCKIHRQQTTNKQNNVQEENNL